MGLDLTFEEWIRFEQRAKEKNPSRKTKDQPRFEMGKKRKEKMYLWFSASRINDPSLELCQHLYPEEFGPYPEDHREQLKGFVSRRA